MNKVKATVIIPATIDRGMLLPYSVGSVQRQTIQDIEIFIIGDGVYDETREVILEMQQKDDRIKFFDHPKHERRGEVYRHMALQEANGEIVCYLCDRDLMFPDHIETHLDILQSYDFSSTVCIYITPEGKPISHHLFGHFGDYSECPGSMKKHIAGLSNISHTLEYYKNNDVKWTTTPKDNPTDVYMWSRILANDECRAFLSSKSTLLYFRRNPHPGWPTIQRLPEIKHWSGFLNHPSQIERIKDEASQTTMLELKKLQIDNAIVHKTLQDHQETIAFLQEKLTPYRARKNSKKEVGTVQHRIFKVKGSRFNKLLFHLKLASYQTLMIIKEFKFW